VKSRFRKCLGICLRTGVLGLLLSAWTVGLVAAESRPLRILLTNDDGYDAPGLRVLRDALLAEGHDVTVVAPLQNRSGSGIRVSIGGTIDVQEQGEGIWSVDGFPADSVLVGLQEYFADEAPDLVVSGANFGPNLGFAGSSGTVGAHWRAGYRCFCRYKSS
jgi:5'-nucleotidase